MFTGIVTGRGRVVEAEPRGEGRHLAVRLGPVAERQREGDSVAVAGVCLTLVAAPEGDVGRFLCVRETLERTTLGLLRPGHEVNLEPALRVGDPLGGHMVQGHVDGVGTVRSMEGTPGAVVLSVAAPPDVRPWLVRKGSVTVDGVSLTVVTVDAEGFTVALIPHTLERTTLSALRPGSWVNLEADPIGKWVGALLAGHGGDGGSRRQQRAE